MGSFSIWHWVIVLIIVMLVFGTKKLRNIGQDLGGAVKGFKEGMKEAGADTPTRKRPLLPVALRSGYPAESHQLCPTGLGADRGSADRAGC